jgi:hypothetical protein
MSRYLIFNTNQFLFFPFPVPRVEPSNPQPQRDLHTDLAACLGTPASSDRQSFPLFLTVVQRDEFSNPEPQGDLQTEIATCLGTPFSGNSQILSLPFFLTVRESDPRIPNLNMI